MAGQALYRESCNVTEYFSSSQPFPPPSDSSLCVSLVQQLPLRLFPRAPPHASSLAKFIEKFLLECNSTATRWQAHELMVALHQHTPPQVHTLS